MDTFKSGSTTIGKFFGTKDTIYRVPLYQREYSWSEENIDALFEDLTQEDSYFLGTFVLNDEFYKSEGVKDIVDGQQRILTLTIFFAVLRDIFLELKDKDKSNQIQSNYISNKDDDGEDMFKVLASSSAKDFFQKNVQTEKQKIEETDPKTNEHKKIVLSYLSIKEKIYSELKKFEKTEEKIDKLKEIREALKELELIVIEVNSEEDAFVFFETLNSRGTDLQQADLIKNLIYKNIDKKNEHIELEWNKIVESISNSENAEVTQFIRHYWLSRYKKVNEAFLFKNIKTTYKSKSYEKLLGELVNESENYRIITSPSENDWKKTQLGLYRILKNIQSLNVSQSRSILLTLVRILKDEKFFTEHGTKKVYQAFQNIENFTIAFTSVVHKSPSALENIYSKYALLLNEVYTKKEKKARNNLDAVLDKFKDELQSKLPTKNEFIDNFIKIEYKKSKKQLQLISHLLQRINYGGNTEQRFDHVNIEHIMPQNPDAEWKIKKKDIKNFVNNIGNLTPLGPEYNRDASNFVISKKVSMYEKSKIEMTKKLISTLKRKSFRWTEKDIEKRSNEMANEMWTVLELK